MGPSRAYLWVAWRFCFLRCVYCAQHFWHKPVLSVFKMPQSDAKLELPHSRVFSGSVSYLEAKSLSNNDFDMPHIDAEVGGSFWLILFDNNDLKHCRSQNYGQLWKETSSMCKLFIIWNVSIEIWKKDCVISQSKLGKVFSFYGELCISDHFYSKALLNSTV